MPETGPDLSFAQQAIERLMDDTCRIERPASGPRDVDEDGNLLPAGPPQLIYEGICKVAPLEATTVEEVQYSQDLTSPYEVTIPLDTPVFREPDEVTILTSRRDPMLVGKLLIVRRVPYSTFAVQRKLLTDLQEPR